MLFFILSVIFFILSVVFLFSVIKIPGLSDVEKLLFSLLISFATILVVILFVVGIVVILSAAGISF